MPNLPSSSDYKRPAAPAASSQPARPSVPSTSSAQPARSRAYALTDTEDLVRYSASPRAAGRVAGRKQFSSDTEQSAGANVEPPKRRQVSKAAQNAEDIRQKRVQKNQQQLKRYFELLRLKNQVTSIVQKVHIYPSYIHLDSLFQISLHVCRFPPGVPISNPCPPERDDSSAISRDARRGGRR